MKRFALIGVLLFLVLTACVMGPRTQLSVSGAIERDLSRAQVAYEQTSEGRQLYVHQIGPGEDMIVLDILMPADLVPGTYDVATTGPVNAAYYEFVDGVSRRFDVDVRGLLTVSKADDSFAGELALSAFASGQDGEGITVTGEFRGIPYNRAGIQGLRASGTMAALVIIAAFVVFLVANFAFQFYVGRQIYSPEAGWALRSLRGTRTFVRGWRTDDLRPVMGLWSLALAGVLLCAILLLLMGRALF
jgi:hypothetical protein